MYSLISLGCSFLAGAAFVAAGISKLLDPDYAVRHLAKLGFPERWVFHAVWIEVAGELTLGLALMLRISPVLFPLAILILIGLSGLTIWAATAKRVTSCGCFGGAILLRPWQSVVLNAVCCLLLLLAAIWPAPALLSPRERIGALLLATPFFAWNSFLLLWLYRRHNISLVDLTQAKFGKPFRADWIAGFDAEGSGVSQMVVFIKPTCAICKSWIPILNKISRRSDIPALVVAMDTEGVNLGQFRQEHGIAFAIQPVKPRTVHKLIRRFPTVLVVGNGLIQEKYEAALPPRVIEQFRQSRERALTSRYPAGQAAL
jgi:hypothetical protein